SSGRLRWHRPPSRGTGARRCGAGETHSEKAPRSAAETTAANQTSAINSQCSLLNDFGQLAASFATKPTKPRKHEEVRDFVVAFRGLGSMNRLRFLVHVVHQDVLAERIRGRKIRLAFADLGDTADEAYEIVVAGQHESVDHDPAFPARRHFRARFGDDERVEAEGVLVNAAIRLSQRRRLAVGDHDDLAHVFALAIENPAGEPEAFTRVRVVGADADAAELRQWD